MRHRSGVRERPACEGPDGRGVVAVVDLDAGPLIGAEAIAKPGDVVFELEPAFGRREASATERRSLEQLVTRPQLVARQVADPARSDFGCAALLHLCGGDTLVQAGVTELVRILGTEVVVEELVVVKEPAAEPEGAEVPPPDETEDAEKRQRPIGPGRRAR